jgi:hypothetical protein
MLTFADLGFLSCLTVMLPKINLNPVAFLVEVCDRLGGARFMITTTSCAYLDEFHAVLNGLVL